MRDCENCTKPTRDNAYVCDTCADKVARRLGEVPWVMEQLEVTLTKQHAASDDATGSSRETALIYDERASKKRGALRHALVMAVRFCDEEGVRHQSPSNDLPADDEQAMARWLMWRIDGLQLNDMGAQIMADVANAVRACKRVIDKPPERRYCGPCPECERDLYHRPDVADVTCVGCGSTFDVGEVNDWMRGRLTEHLTGRLVTASEGAGYLGRMGIEISQRTIDKWHQRKRIVDHGTNGGKRVYLWEDLLDLAARHAV